MILGILFIYFKFNLKIKKRDKINEIQSHCEENEEFNELFWFCHIWKLNNSSEDRKNY